MTEIIAHRGSRVNRPENTLAAFREAIRVGADGIELDVQWSKDKIIMVIHDETVDRTTDGSGSVADLTVAELQSLDAGSWFPESEQGERIPTLQEVLDLLDSQAYAGTLHIELKTAKCSPHGFEKALWELVSKNRHSFTVVYSSFQPLSLWRLYRLDSSLQLAFLISRDNLATRILRQLPIFSALHVSRSYAKKQGSRLKKPMRIWTVNEEKELLAVFEQRVPAVITDRPEEAINLRKQAADDCAFS